MGKALYRTGWLAATRPWVFLAAWAALLVSVVALVNVYGSNTSDNLDLPGTGSQAATDLLAAAFPPQQNGTSPLVFHASSGKVTDAANMQAIESSRAALLKIPQVSSATDPFGQQGQAQVSKDGQTAFIPVLLTVSSSDVTEELAQSVLDTGEPAAAAGMEVAVGGPVGSELSEPDTGSSELIGLISATVILLFAFGSVVAMGMPIVSAVIGLVVGLATIGLLGHIVTVPSIAPTIATMIGLGVGIDYALFLVSRHREHLRDGMPVHESIALTVATSGSAIVYAGGTVVIALLALAVAGIPLVTALGYASAVAVATAVLGAVTLVPALLGVAGAHVGALRLPAFLRPTRREPGHGFWAGWARFVTRRPWITALGALALLAPLLIPFGSLQFGQVDVGASPESTTQRQAYDAMTDGFGVGYNGPLLVAVDLGTPATPSSEYESQLSQAQSLQQQLEQEQAQGTTQKNQLTAQSNALRAQQAELEKQQSALERQQQSLEQQAKQLETEQAALQTQAQALAQEAGGVGAAQATLTREQAALAARARTLEQRIASTSRSLARTLADARATEAALARAANPKTRSALRAKLRALDRREASLERRLSALRRQEQALLAQEDALRTREAALRRREASLVSASAALARQAASLVGEAVGLVEQKQQLEQQAAALQLQASQLQTQAAQLQTQQAQLEGQQQQGQTQKQQAEQLQAELTQELTQAGGDPRGTDPRLVTLQDALGAVVGVAIVSPPAINGDGEAAIFNVIATTAPSSPDTADLVRTLRTYTIPQATNGTDLTVDVGGSTAANVDLAAEISSRLLWVIAAVIALSFLVLMTAYRSLVVPAQAALANILAVSAAFGVLTATFQWGWGLGLIGLGGVGDSVPIASYVPLMMFAVLFGLSMDYQVFLLSQIEHVRSQGRGVREAVAGGLESSARVIAAAALIMMSVFGSFIVNGDPTVKQFGVGLSVGVGLAAFMVLTFAPAVLVIVGEASWWLPGRLGRLLPRIDIEGASQEHDGPAADTI
jgi:uncharacterized membrane protein YdfJ with MMPL/SSD domain